jgi:hypothetical protein
MNMQQQQPIRNIPQFTPIHHPGQLQDSTEVGESELQMDRIDSMSVASQQAREKDNQ